MFLEYAKVDSLIVNTQSHSILHKTWHIFGSLSLSPYIYIFIYLNK